MATKANLVSILCLRPVQTCWNNDIYDWKQVDQWLFYIIKMVVARKIFFTRTFNFSGKTGVYCKIFEHFWALLASTMDNAEHWSV